MPRYHGTRKPYTDEITRVQFTEEEEAQADIDMLSDIRGKRDQLLAETDWWGASDNTMSDAQKAYRLALRNFPATVDISNIVWPTKP